MTRGEIKTQFTKLFNRRDLTADTALVDSFMDQAIMRVQRDLRVPAMEKSVDVPVGDTFDGILIPNDLLELKEIRPLANNKKLRKTSLDRALVAATVAGTPLVYARQDGTWVVGPTPASGDIIRVTYYAEMNPLAADNDENILTIIAWDLFTQAALVKAAQHYIDKRKDDFEASYQEILASLQEQADADELGDNAELEPALHYPHDNEECP